MVIVFLPAVEGLRPQWREATETLGGTTWTYWRRVAGPILLPSFVGGMLLLFTNAFSAYATAKALISQGNPLLPLQIGGTMSSEVILGQENVGKAMALAMIVVVAVVMTAYGFLDRSKPLDELRRQALITPKAQASGVGPDFSSRIRER